MVKKRGKKNTKSRSVGEPKRPLQLKDDDQEYALITKQLGGGTFTAVCMDGRERRALTRSKWPRVNVHDTVLVSLREFESSKEKQNCDIICVYTLGEIRTLKKDKHLPIGNAVSELADSIDANEKEEEEVCFDFDEI